MEVIRRGAESVIYKDFLDGNPVLAKERIRKKYRIDQIDRKIRFTRMREEVKLLREARSLGVPTPRVVKVDDASNTIFMELIEGERLKDFVAKHSLRESSKFFRTLGEHVGRLHSSNIIHGDLTTSNVIVSRGKLFMIDFGLGFFSKRIEDKAMDIRLFSNVMHSTHERDFKKFWSSFAAGYRKEFRGWRNVIAQIGEMRKRVRYSDR